MRVLLLLLLLAPAASANMASPVQPGTPAGEPIAALEGLRIAREALTLDLRPLGLGRRYGVVEAEYRIVNMGGARTLPRAGHRRLHGHPTHLHEWLLDSRQLGRGG